MRTVVCNHRVYDPAPKDLLWKRRRHVPRRKPVSMADDLETAIIEWVRHARAASQTADRDRRTDPAPTRSSGGTTQLSVFEGLSKQATSFDSLRDGVVLYEIMQGLYGHRADA